MIYSRTAFSMNLTMNLHTENSVKKQQQKQQHSKKDKCQIKMGNLMKRERSPSYVSDS